MNKAESIFEQAFIFNYSQYSQSIQFNSIVFTTSFGVYDRKWETSRSTDRQAQRHNASKTDTYSLTDWLPDWLVRRLTDYFSLLIKNYLTISIA